MPDGEGAISGTLKISADGQEPVYIRLTGYSSNPKIITTTGQHQGHVLSQTLTRKSVGTHTLGMEFRTQDTRELRRAAQNYVVGEDANTDNGENGGNSGNDSNGSNSGGGGNDEAENRGEDEGAGDAGNAEAGSRLRATATVITYTVSAGVTLWKIAEKYFGSSAYWTKIYEDNKDSISNPDRIYVGQKIMIYLAEDGAGKTGTEGTVYTVQVIVIPD